MSKTLTAVAVLIGTIIGAGALGIPYVVMKSGFVIGMFHLIIVGFVLTLTMIYLGEIALRTKEDHQLAGYAGKYLGKSGKLVMFLALAFGVYAAIVAYLVGEGESLSFIFFKSTDNALLFGILTWAVVSAISYFDLKALEKGEEIGVAIIAALILSIAVIFWRRIDVSNLSYISPDNFFAPFGVILFAYLGFTAVPEIKRFMNSEKKNIRKSIIIAHVFCFVAYAVFAAVVLGAKGFQTPELSTLALGKVFVLLGMLTMFTSYLSLSIALTDSLRSDFGIGKNMAWLSTITIPLIAFIILQMMNSASFTAILGIGGVISGGLTAILILLMLPRAKRYGERKPEYSMPYSWIITALIGLIFIAGATMEILTHLK